MVNFVILIGNLTHDPELKYLPSGTAVANLRLANNMRYTLANGEKRENVMFIDVVTWGKNAENCKQYLAKGSKVLVEGALQLNQWVDRAGNNHSKIQISAKTIQFLTFKKDSSSEREPVPSQQGEYNEANDDVPF